MTLRANFEDQLQDLIEDGPAEAPSQLLETVLASFPASRTYAGKSPADRQTTSLVRDAPLISRSTARRLGEGSRLTSSWVRSSRARRHWRESSGHGIAGSTATSLPM